MIVHYVFKSLTHAHDFQNRKHFNEVLRHDSHVSGPLPLRTNVRFTTRHRHYQFVFSCVIGDII